MDVSPLAILTVAGVALAFSGLDVLRKVLAERIAPLPLLVLLTLGSMPIFVAWATYEASWRLTAPYVLPGSISIALNVVANLAFLQAVKISPLSLTIPYLSLTPVFTTLLAIPILGEQPTGLQIAGIALVVGGAIWLNLGDWDISLRHLGRSLIEEKGSLLMVLTALCWSLAVPLDKLAVNAATPAVHGVIMMSGITLAGAGLLAGRARLGELRVRSWKPVLAAIVVTAIGAGLSFIALNMVWVGFIETFKRALGSILALVWGRVIFAEQVGSRQLFAVSLMAFGVALILW